MKKDILTIYTGDLYYRSDDVELDDLIKIIQSHKDKGATHAYIDSDDDRPGVSIDFYFRREETDEEFKKRMERIEMGEAAKKARKMMEYERLKNELGL